MFDYIENEDYIFNTRIYQKINTDDNEDIESIINESVKLMRNFEKTLNFYDSDSEVSKINYNAGKSFVRVSQDTFNIIKASKEYSKLTHGIFDITIAPLIKKWGINSNSPNILNMNEIEECLNLVNYENILLDEENTSIMLAEEKMLIDLGGIAKGYIADKIIDFYKSKNVKSALINIGGNVKAFGKKNNDEFWNIGILEPKKHSSKHICCVNLNDESLVTSGGYERAFRYDEKLFHHILNPVTGYPAETDLKSISILNENSMCADALSTPLFIMGKYKAAEFMKTYNISGIMITEDNEIILSSDLIDRFSLTSEYPVLSF